MGTKQTDQLNLLDRFEQQIKQLPHFSAGASLVVAFSGGADSRALLDMLCQLREKYQWRIIAAHLDHQWRATSAHEAMWCERVAREYGIDYVSVRYNDYCEQHPDLEEASLRDGSAEAAARRVRYHFLYSVAQRYGAHALVLAHHRDDQIETFCIRLIRGAGLEGLCCMQIASCHNAQTNGTVMLCRPLLTIARKMDLITYLQERGLLWIEDPTNHADQYLRVCIRKMLIPMFERCDTRSIEGIERAARHLQETQEFVDTLVQKQYAQMIQKDEQGREVLSIDMLRQKSFFEQKLIVLRWLCDAGVYFVPSEALYTELIRFMLNRRTSMHAIYRDWKIVCKQQWARIEKSE